MAITVGVQAIIGAFAGILVNGINNLAVGKRFFQGAAGAALFGAVALPLAEAFPILGLVLAGAGIYGAGTTAWQVYSNPNSTGTQKVAAAFLVALSVFGAYRGVSNASENGLWVNARYLESGGIFGSNKANAMGTALNEINGRTAEFGNVLTTEMPNQTGRITMAVGVAEDEAGAQHFLIGTSEPNGYIRGPMRSLIRPGDTVVNGTGHAEADIVNYSNLQGWRLIGVGATRPICGPCAQEISNAGATAVTPLKQ
jgi:hypothetical protein